MTKEYVDVREIHPQFTQVPCKHCEKQVHVRKHFAARFDYAFCDAHSPLDSDRFKEKPTVRL